MSATRTQGTKGPAGRRSGSRQRRLWLLTAALAAVPPALLAGGCSSTDQILVLTASSAQDPIRELASDTGGTIQVTSGGSHALMEQVAHAGAGDVLVTADARTMNDALARGLIRGEPVVVARSQLVLVTAEGLEGVTGLADLSRPELKLVLCAAEAPCGAAAQRALADAGITVTPSSIEPNSRQALAKVALGEADATLVWLVDTFSARNVRVQRLRDLPQTEYLAAVTASSVQTEQAMGFIRQLQLPLGQGLLAQHGFQLPGGLG